MHPTASVPAGSHAVSPAVSPAVSLAVPAADPVTAVGHFAGRLAVETDPADLSADLAADAPGLVVIDVRGAAAWDQGHLPTAVHCPHADLVARGAELVPAGTTAVVYCWGPGCNGATRAALALARQRIPVKELVGGYEWWVRQGLPVERDGVRRHGPVDPAVGVTSG